MDSVASLIVRTLPLLVLTSLAAVAADVGTARPPLPTQECLDPRVAVDFQRIDADHLAVKTTRGAFRLDLADQCLDLIGRSRLQFKSARADNRLCGLLGEYVVLPGGSCRIGAIAPISAEDYRALTEHKKPDTKSP